MTATNRARGTPAHDQVRADPLLRPLSGNPIITALAALIDSALPWREYLNLNAPALYTDDALSEMIEADAHAA